MFQLARVLPTAFAAMAEVPMVDTTLSTMILPSWNMLFSRPFGSGDIKDPFDQDRIEAEAHLSRRN